MRGYRKCHEVLLTARNIATFMDTPLARRVDLEEYKKDENGMAYFIQRVDLEGLKKHCVMYAIDNGLFDYLTISTLKKLGKEAGFDSTLRKEELIYYLKRRRNERRTLIESQNSRDTSQTS